MRNLDTTKTSNMHGPDYPSLQAATQAREAQRTTEHIAAVREARAQTKKATRARATRNK
jgi:homogentisate 1,2-dioxygenase